MKQRTKEEIQEMIRGIFNKKNHDDYLKTLNTDPNDFGGIIHKKCVHCGGVVGCSGFGIIRETCSSCGKEHTEPRY